MLIDQTKINSFVTAVETKKGFARNPDKVFRHIVSELGELDNQMHLLETLRIDEKFVNFIKLDTAQKMCKDSIGRELLDIIFLACYMADLYGTDLNALAPGRMEAILKQYQVAWPIEEKKKRRDLYE